MKKDIQDCKYPGVEPLFDYQEIMKKIAKNAELTN